MIYDRAATGRGSILDNPYLAKLVYLITIILYYIIHFLYLSFMNVRLFILRNINLHMAILFTMVFLSVTLCVLYTKIY